MRRLLFQMAIVVIGVWMVSGTATTQLLVDQVSSLPAVDGVLDDAAWSGAQVATLSSGLNLVNYVQYNT